MANVVSNLVIQLQVTGAAQAKAQLASVQASLAQLLGIGGASSATGGNIGGINVAAMNIGAVGTITRIGGTGTVVNISNIGTASFSGNAPGQQQNQRTGINAVFDVLRVTQMVFREFTSVMRDFVEMQRSIAQIQEMTGGTTKESGAIAMLMRAGGMSDTQGLRAIIHGLEAQQRGPGLAAQHLLGVHTTPGESGTAIFLEAVRRLSEMQDGVRKTNLEIQIFGARGTAAIQGMLHMAQETNREILALGDTMDTSLPRAVQEFTGEWQAFSETFEQDVIGPFLHVFLPLATQGLEALTILLQDIHDFFGDDIMGILEMAAAFGAVAAAVGTVISAIKVAGGLLAALGITAGTLSGVTETAIIVAAAAGIGSTIAGYIDKHFLGQSDDDKAAQKLDTTNDLLYDIRGQLMGNAGPNARRTISEIEKDYVFAHQIAHKMA